MKKQKQKKKVNTVNVAQMLCLADQEKWKKVNKFIGTKKKVLNYSNSNKR